MNKLKNSRIPISLEGLNEKLSFEIKRLVREREDGIVKHVRTKTILNGISTVIFKNESGKNITLLYRHDESGSLRFAREKQFVA